MKDIFHMTIAELGEYTCDLHEKHYINTHGIEAWNALTEEQKAKDWLMFVKNLTRIFSGEPA